MNSLPLFRADLWLSTVELEKKNILNNTLNLTITIITAGSESKKKCRKSHQSRVGRDGLQAERQSGDCGGCGGGGVAAAAGHVDTVGVSAGRNGSGARNENGTKPSERNRRRVGPIGSGRAREVWFRQFQRLTPSPSRFICLFVFFVLLVLRDLTIASRRRVF